MIPQGAKNYFSTFLYKTTPTRYLNKNAEEKKKSEKVSERLDVQEGAPKESLQISQDWEDALLQEAIKMPRRRGPTRAASRKGGRKAGKASKFCSGKKGRSFQACRRAWFRRH